MHILDLPLELLQEILFRSIQSRGLRRGLRLRLVNKIFAKEAVESIFVYRLLDNYFASIPKGTKTPIPPYTTAYLERCVISETSGKNNALAWIRSVAEELARKDERGRSTQTFVKELCQLVVKEYGQNAAQLWRDDSGHDAAYMEKHTFVAALMTDTKPIIQAWLASGKQSDINSLYFGSTRRYVEDNGDHSLLATMMTITHANQKLRQSLRLSVFAGAARAGRLDATRYAYSFDIVECPWHFSRAKPKVPGVPRERPKELGYARANEETLATLHTPNEEVFDFLMEKRRLHCIDRHFGPEQWTIFLHHCATKGWEEMASKYLKLGASVNGGCGVGNTGNKRPLIEACTNGHVNIVELLLRWGADVSAPALETAAHFGHADIVRSLLKHGAETGVALCKAAAMGYRVIVQELLDNGTHDPESLGLLKYAIEKEDEVMCQVLIRSGNVGDLAECVALAKTQGLESMLDLLDNTAVIVGNAQTRQKMVEHRIK